MAELYPEPESFEPRRWESLDPSTYEYIPFGAGPRRCIGDVFALVEMKIIISMLVQRFRLEFPARMKVDRVGFPVIRPKSGLPVVIRSQDRRFDVPASILSGNVREMVAFPVTTRRLHAR
jgi:cytochrome P450